MGDLLGTGLSAAGLFAGTDVDDLIVLTLMFLAARATGTPRPWQIWAGQYLGIAVLVAGSAAAALGLALVPDRWVPLLGLVPIGIGLWQLVGAVRHDADDDERPPTAAGVLPVAGITIANGADNIAVYTPMFRTIGAADSVVVVAVFAVMVAVWCAAAAWLGSHRAIVAAVSRWGHWIVPVVFIALGGWILSGLR
ncbi:MAG TPA: cadmium resistance transporter [Actinoplanes sp.]|nr:cadmium resistance transporter [Actinoplanes sp.]